MTTDGKALPTPIIPPNALPTNNSNAQGTQDVKED